MVQLQARVKAALRFKDVQDRSELLNQQLLATNGELEESLNARDLNLAQVRNGLVLALAKLVEYRDSETGQHLVRMQATASVWRKRRPGRRPSRSRSTPASSNCWWAAYLCTTSARPSCRTTFC